MSYIDGRLVSLSRSRSLPVEVGHSWQRRAGPAFHELFLSSSRSVRSTDLDLVNNRDVNNDHYCTQR